MGNAVGCEGTPRSGRRCRGFAPQSERQGLVTGLSPSMSETVDLRVLYQRLAHPRPNTTRNVVPAATGPGVSICARSIFGIPSWLVPCVHDDVKDLLGRSRDVDHGDRRPGRAPPREPGGQTRWQSDSEHRWKQQRVAGSRWHPLRDERPRTPRRSPARGPRVGDRRHPGRPYSAGPWPRAPRRSMQAIGLCVVAPRNSYSRPPPRQAGRRGSRFIRDEVLRQRLTALGGFVVDVLGCSHG